MKSRSFIKYYFRIESLLVLDEEDISMLKKFVLQVVKKVNFSDIICLQHVNLFSNGSVNSKKLQNILLSFQC